ncbi:glycosyltransferase [Mucilaginibacter sp.]|jgi:hypothetical protein|uniref:glycosyltransferase n=1 Tax=Mucilaginibacter sp. TaxID=1882438 RepID=UPI0035672235
MISVIISSINPEQLSRISKNIEDTIGTPYELIATDNRGSDKGICQVYNEAAAKARYEILCFIHEDIIIKTDNWGKGLASLFKQDPKLGLVGVAGTGYVPLSPANFGPVGIDTRYINIIQGFKFKKKKQTLHYRNPNNEKLAYVACLDGVWLTTTKSVFAEFKFDEKTFKKFHCYDMDLSLSVGTKYKLAVTYDLLIEHLSEGRYDKEWLEENMNIFNKWNDVLPLNKQNLSPEEVFKAEKLSFKFFVNQLVEFKLPLSIALNMLSKNNRFYFLSKLLFLKLRFYIFKKKLA